MGTREQTLFGIKRICWTIILGCLINGVVFPVGIGSEHNDTTDDTTDFDETDDQDDEDVCEAVDCVFETAAVAADAAVCSRVGSDIMELKGGSAVDAAIATLLCVGIVHPHSTGIGGGFFKTLYNSASQTSEVMMARERAPLAATANMFAPETGVSSRDGGMAIAVPGEIAGYWEMHQKYGKVPWKELFQPSIKIAREGITIGKNLARAINSFEDQLDIYPALKELFFDENTGALKTEGGTFTQIKLADTYETLANGNKDTFYDGSLTDDIIADITEAGGIITPEDLKIYTADWQSPVTLALSDGMTVYSVLPPASGVVFEYILNILEGFGFTSDDVSTTEKTVLTYHRVTEAMKFAFAKRTNLGDADFVDVTELVFNMTSQDFAAAIKAQINDATTFPTEYYGPTFFTEDGSGTSHVSILDKDGLAVGITSTHNLWFGSKVIGSRTGIIFNNEMDDFSTPNVTNAFGINPSPANFIAPGKRPLSSMCPSVVVDADGEVKLIVGASGGTRITTSSALVALGTLRFGKDVGVAINESRIHHQLLPEEVFVENTILQVYIDGLMQKGH